MRMSDSVLCVSASAFEIPFKMSPPDYSIIHPPFHVSSQHVSRLCLHCTCHVTSLLVCGPTCAGLSLVPTVRAEPLKHIHEPVIV